MKLFIILLLAATTAFANTGDTIMICHNTSFADLDQILVTSSSNKMGEMLVTEIDENGTKSFHTQKMSDMKALDIQLSDWYGYSRRLYYDGNSWMIEHRDECSGSAHEVVCE